MVQSFSLARARTKTSTITRQSTRNGGRERFHAKIVKESGGGQRRRQVPACVGVCATPRALFFGTGTEHRALACDRAWASGPISRSGGKKRANLRNDCRNSEHTQQLVRWLCLWLLCLCAFVCKFSERRACVCLRCDHCAATMQCRRREPSSSSAASSSSLRCRSRFLHCTVRQKFVGPRVGKPLLQAAAVAAGQTS